MPSAIAFSVDDRRLLPSDAVFVTNAFYGPVYRLASSALVIVDPRAAVNLPGLPTVASATAILLGADPAGNPVYGVTAGGQRLSDVVSVPSLERATLTPITQGSQLVVPAGYRLAGHDAQIATGDGRPAAVFVSTTDATRFFIPGVDSLPTGTATSVIDNPAPVATAAPTPGATSIADGQTIWLAPVDPLTRQGLITGAGLDFDDLIAGHSGWGTIGRDVGVLSIYGFFFLAATDQEIRNLLAFVAQHGLKLAVQTGAVSIQPGGVGTGVEGFITGHEIHDIAARIKALGGTADYLVLDEPAWFPTAIGVPLQDTVRSAVDNVQQFLNIFPQAKVGDQEPVGGYVTAAMYAAFQALWKADAGRTLDFVQFDVDWTSPQWKTDMAALVATARALGQSVTTIFNSGPSDTTSASWTADAAQHAIEVSRDPTLRPDGAVFQSWESAPALIGAPGVANSLGGEIGTYLATQAGSGPATPAAVATTAAAVSPWSITLDQAGVMRSRTQVQANQTTITVTYDARGYADQVTRSASGAILSATTNEPLFDVAFYLRTYGASLPAGADPLVYFETTGWRLGQNPSAAFSTAHYVKTAGHTIQGNPLQDYEAQGLWTDLSPSALFDPTFYKARNPDVVAANVGLFEHYLSYGVSDGRDPSPLLSLNFYEGQSGAGSVSADPLIDYAQAGWKLGLDPSPLFDTSYYLNRYPDVATSGMDPLTEYLDEGWTLGRSPTPWFDPAYYLAHNPDVAAAGVDPLLHFLEIGWTQGRDPSAAFSVSTYLRYYPSIAAAGINPLIHYVQYGQAQGYVAVPATAHQTTADPLWQILGTFGPQGTTSDRPMQPFAGTVLIEPVTGWVGTVQITLTGLDGRATDADGTLSGSGATKTGVGTYVISGTSDALTTTLHGLVFTPLMPAGTTRVETDFALQLTSGGSGRDTGTAVITVAPPAPVLPTAVATTAAATPTVPAQDALFDPVYYLQQNPDVRAAGVDPWQHYVAYGWKEGRNPNALFDTKYYEAQNPDVAAAHVDPLMHFEVFGWHEGRSPNALFNTSYYLAQNPDVAASGMNPLAHFEQFGWHEGRSPDPLFNTSYYLAQNPDVAASGMDPLVHFEVFGWHEGRNPDPLFNPAYYLAHNPDVAAAGIDPLVHFEQSGWREGRDPSAAFSTTRYLAANPDVRAAGMDPLLHYLVSGQAEHRAIFPA